MYLFSNWKLLSSKYLADYWVTWVYPSRQVKDGTSLDFVVKASEADWDGLLPSAICTVGSPKIGPFQGMNKDEPHEPIEKQDVRKS